MKYRAYAIIVLVLSISWGHAAESSIEKSAATDSASKSFTVTGTLKAMELPSMQKHTSGRGYYMAAAGGGSTSGGFKSTNGSGDGIGGAGGNSSYSIQHGTGPIPDDIKQHQKDIEQYHKDFAKYQKQQHEYRVNQPQGNKPPTPPSFPAPFMNPSQNQTYSLSSKPLTPAEQEKQWISQIEEEIQLWNTRNKMAINEQDLIKEYAVKENATATIEKINELIQLKKTAAKEKIKQLNREKQYISKNGALPPNRTDSSKNNPAINQATTIETAKKSYYNRVIREHNDNIADLQHQLKVGLAELNTLKQLANRENASDTVKFINSIIEGKKDYTEFSIDGCKQRIAGYEAKRDGKANPSGQNMGGGFGAGGPQGGTSGGAQGGGSTGGGAKLQQ